MDQGSESRNGAVGSEGHVQILLVDDNPTDAALVVRALTRSKIATHVHIAKDGEEALDFIFCRGSFASRSPEDLPDLVILDLKLPRLHGNEVLRQIRANPATDALRVVILTSSRQDQDITESYRLGANSFIVKPVEFDRFFDVIRQIGSYWLQLNEAARQGSERATT